jgi:purine-binding chemotaxis protein CheW
VAIKRQLVIFRIGSEEFAIDIIHAKEVVVRGEVTKVPGTASFVEGVMNLRGSLLPVMDLRKRLRARPTASPAETRIMVVNLGGKLIGLIVDAASEVIRVGDEAIEPPPDLITESEIGYVEGVVNLRGRFITLIDLRRVFEGDVLWGLDEVVAAIREGRGQRVPAQAV